MFTLTTPESFEDRIRGKVISVGYGGGLNSVAMMITMVRRGIRPAYVLMADVGGEKPRTYEVANQMHAWLLDRGFPGITVVRWKSKKWGDTTLEQECQRIGSLPSIAFGWKKCSEKWKQRPQKAVLRASLLCRAEWAAGRKVMQFIGFDAGELKRIKYPADKRFDCEYPLYELGIFREDCLKIAESEGFDVPKSACFFCPSSKTKEILQLREEHPELMDRALTMEDAALPNLTSIKGLGRRFNWRTFLAKFDADAADKKALIESEEYKAPEQDCGCFDG